MKCRLARVDNMQTKCRQKPGRRGKSIKTALDCESKKLGNSIGRYSPRRLTDPLEHITTNTSYRKLAEKYGVHYNAVANRAKQEDWISQRNQFCDRTVTKTVNSISKKREDRAARLHKAAHEISCQGR